MLLRLVACLAFTDLTASNPYPMPFVTCMHVARVLSLYQLPYTVRSHSPLFCQASFIHDEIKLDAHNVCTRAKNHYDPQQVHRLFNSDIARTEDSRDHDRAMARRDGGSRNAARSQFQSSFQQAHERQASRMYFV